MIVNASIRSSVPAMRLKPLAACLAAVLGLVDTGTVQARAQQPQVTFVVTNCEDDGPGSLRAAAREASAGDFVDLTQLPCSTISLSSGAIAIADALTLTGPGRDLLTIDGQNESLVFVEAQATATLAIAGMTIENGYIANGYGGCVYSAGSVELAPRRDSSAPTASRTKRTKDRRARTSRPSPSK
jgi:hypothetical protein